MGRGNKDLPLKSNLEATPLWSTAIDAQLRSADEEAATESTETSHRDEWLAEALAEYGATPPVAIVADHYAAMNDLDQSVFFDQLNQSCGCDYAEAVVTTAKKKQPA